MVRRSTCRLVVVAAAMLGAVPLYGHLAAQATQSQPPQPRGGAAGVVSLPPPRDQPAPPRSGRAAGVMRGRLTRADTGAPIAHAMVSIEGPIADRTRMVQSDESGRYEFTGLPAGRYLLVATKSGFVQALYGSRGTGTKATRTPVDVGERQIVNGLDMAMAPGGAIEGVIFDQYGDPVENAAVQLMRRVFVDGERRIQSAGIANTTTDDLGRFRLHGIPAGTYYLAAGIASVTTLAGAYSQIVNGWYPGVAPTYFPGTTSPSDARSIVLSPAQQLTGVAMQLQSVHLSRINGTVKGASDADYPTASIWLVRKSGGGQGADPLEDWSFSFGSLLPGEYAVMARAGDQGAFTHLTVSGDDVSVTLVPGRLWRARGRIRIESDTVSPLRPADVRLELMPVDAAPLPDEIKDLQRIGDDWSFEQPGVIGSYLVRVRTSGRWVIKSVERHGEDVTDTPIDFTGADVDDITVVLTDRISSVSGRVTAAVGSSPMGAPVFVFADDARLWGPRSRYLQTAVVTRDGTYTIRGLPAGRYLAVAADDLDTDDGQDPEVLESLRRRATMFTLGDGEATTVDLKLGER